MFRVRLTFAAAVLTAACVCLQPTDTSKPLARKADCSSFEGPIDSCNQLCVEDYGGRVEGPDGLGKQGDKFASLLRTAWATQPTVIRSYTPDRPPNKHPCEYPGAGHAYYCALDDSITYDATLMSTLDRFGGDMAAVVVFAHEWGHVNQARSGLLEDNERTPVENELHADCQAGSFAAVLQAWGELRRDDVSDAFFALCHFADSEGFFDPLGHGDCEVRRNAFMYGYRTAQFRIDELCGQTPVAVVTDICAY